MIYFQGLELYAAPLSRLDWLRIVPSTFTKEFFTAELRPRKTLGFFYEALDQVTWSHLSHFKSFKVVLSHLKAMLQVEQDFGAEAG